MEFVIPQIEIGYHGDDFPRNRMSVKASDSELNLLITFDWNNSIDPDLQIRLFRHKASKRFKLLKEFQEHGSFRMYG